jgi:hypothetical protein
MGRRVVERVAEGEVVGFIGPPGQLNIRLRRVEPRAAIKESGTKQNFFLQIRINLP